MIRYTEGLRKIAETRRLVLRVDGMVKLAVNEVYREGGDVLAINAIAAIDMTGAGLWEVWFYCEADEEKILRQALEHLP